MSSESCHAHLTRALQLPGWDQIWTESGHGPDALTPFQEPLSKLTQAILMFLGWPETQQTRFHLVSENRRNEHTLVSTFQEKSGAQKLATLSLNHSRTNPMDEGLSLTLRVENFGPGDSRLDFHSGGWCSMAQKLEVTAYHVTEELFEHVLEIATQQFQG